MNEKKKILMLGSSLSSSAAIIPYIYGNVMKDEYDVTIIGPLFGKDPVIDMNKFKTIVVEPKINLGIQASMITLIKTNYDRLKEIYKDYDAIHVFKLLPHTIIPAYKIHKKTGIPIILTIDDYDSESPQSIIKRTILKWSERYMTCSKIKFVCSTKLQEVYGGTILYQVANEELHDPTKYNKNELKRKYDLEGKIIISHTGTLYPHKGADILIKAVQRLNDDNVKLILFEYGTDVERLKKLSGSETIWIKQVEFDRVIEWVALSDICVIPTLSTEYSEAQTPAKIFEYMAMGKPIIASRVADIPTFLENGKFGKLVNPGNVEELRKEIKYFLDNPEEMERFGKLARQRYDDKYNSENMKKILFDEYKKVWSGE